MVPCRLADPARVDTMGFKPLAVASEVVLACCTDEQRPQAKAAKPERDVRRDAAAPDHERIHQEGTCDVVQLVGHQLIDEPAGKGHQVVGGDRSRHCYAHGGPSEAAEPLVARASVGTRSSWRQRMHKLTQVTGCTRARGGFACSTSCRARALRRAGAGPPRAPAT